MTGESAIIPKQNPDLDALYTKTQNGLNFMST